MTNNEITIIEKQVSPVVQQASQLAISSTEQLTSASELREKIKEVQKQVEDDKERLYRPIKDALDEVNTRYAPFEKPLKDALKIVNDKMSVYQTAEIARAKAEADKIAARVAPGKGNLSVGKALEKIEAIEAPVELDLTGFTNRPVVVVTNDSLIPRHFLIPDFKAIEIALKAGTVVPGVILENRYTPKSK